MLKRSNCDGRVRVTFAWVTDDELSVVGDFNGWDPFANPLVRRSNGTRSSSVVVDQGVELRFRYLDARGSFFDEPDADIEPNGWGSTHSVLRA